MCRPLWLNVQSIQKRTDLKKWAGDKFDYSKSGDSEYYDYYDDDNEGSIYINCKKTVSSMSVKKETWPSK